MVRLVRRASDQVGPVADAAIPVGAKVLWLQLGVADEGAADGVVEDRCPKIELLRAG